MNLHIRQIEKARDFMILGPMWSQLARESGQTSPFLSYDWFWCCWHGVWPQHQPEILVIEKAGAARAIVPLMHWRTRLHGLPVRCLGFLECPDTPVADMLIVEQHEQVIEALLAHLMSRSDWDIVWFQKLPEGSTTLEVLRRALPLHWSWQLAHRCFSPYLTVSGDWASFYRARPAYIQDTFEEAQEHLWQAGDVRVEQHCTMEPGNAFFHEVIDVICHGWAKKPELGVAAMLRTAEFFRELTRRADRNEWLSLWSLRLNGHLVAIEYQLRSQGQVQVLRSGEAPTLRKFLAETALSLTILQSLFECRTIHEYCARPRFQEEQLWWASGCAQTVDVKLYRPALYSRVLHGVETALTPRARRWLARPTASSPLTLQRHLEPV